MISNKIQDKIYSLAAVCVKPEDSWQPDANCDTGGENIYNIISLQDHPT